MNIPESYLETSFPDSLQLEQLSGIWFLSDVCCYHSEAHALYQWKLMLDSNNNIYLQ